MWMLWVILFLAKTDMVFNEVYEITEIQRALWLVNIPGVILRR